MIKLVKNRKLNHAHAHKSFSVVSPKECIFVLGKWIYVPNLIKIGREMGALSWAEA